MSYQNSKNQLPKELIKQVQEYVDGEVIYIPKKKTNKKQWGENTDTRQFFAMRNNQIFNDYNKGMSICQLAGKYFLSEKSIQRILKQKK